MHAGRGDRRRMEDLIIPDHLKPPIDAGMARYLAHRRKARHRQGAGAARSAPQERRGVSGGAVDLDRRVRTRRIFVSFARDISHRVAAERELIKARDDAVAGERAKADLIAVMSHEMRTPLNGMLGTLDFSTPRRATPRTPNISTSSAPRASSFCITSTPCSKCRAPRPARSSPRNRGLLAPGACPRTGRKPARRGRAPRQCAVIRCRVEIRRAGTTGSGRSDADPAGAAEPRRQRDQVHPQRVDHGRGRTSCRRRSRRVSRPRHGIGIDPKPTRTASSRIS
jgi:signal transduction histidine kinase